MTSVAVSLALAGAGCGESEEAKFRKEKLNPIEQRIEEGKGRVSARLGTVRLKNRRDSRDLMALIAALAADVRRLSELDPPDSASEELERSVRAHQQLVTELRRFAAALRKGQRGALSRIAARAQSAAGAARRASNQLDEALNK